LLDDAGDDLRRDRLHIGGVGDVRIRHDGGRIGIDEDDAIALGLESLAGLRTRVVEFASLTDDDRPSTDDQDRRKIGSFWHCVTGKTGSGTKKAASQAPPRKLPPACGRLSVAASGALSHNRRRGKSMARLTETVEWCPIGSGHLGAAVRSCCGSLTSGPF